MSNDGSNKERANDKTAIVIPFHGSEKVAAKGQAVERFGHHHRMVEAILFASREPVSLLVLKERLPDEVDVERILAELKAQYAGRGVCLVEVAGGWAFRTADDLAFLLQGEAEESRKLSRAALETLAIIAYHQPVTRAEIEEIRGVSMSKGTLDVLLATGWVRLRGRRRVPGRPVTYGTTPAFLDHFMLEAIGDLPGLDDLKSAGLLDSAMPVTFKVPQPSDDDRLASDEDPLDDDDLLMMTDLITEDEEA